MITTESSEYSQPPLFEDTSPPNVSYEGGGRPGEGYADDDEHPSEAWAELGGNPSAQGEHDKTKTQVRANQLSPEGEAARKKAMALATEARIWGRKQNGRYFGSRLAKRAVRGVVPRVKGEPEADSK